MLLTGSGRSRWTDPRTDTRRGRRLQPPRLWAPRESLRPRLARNLRSAADASPPGDPDRSAALARGTGGRGGRRGSPLLDGLGGVIADGPAGAALASAPVSEDGRRCLASHAKPERLTTGARSRGGRDDAKGRRGAPGKQACWHSPERRVRESLRTIRFDKSGNTCDHACVSCSRSVMGKRPPPSPPVIRIARSPRNSLAHAETPWPEGG